MASVKRKVANGDSGGSAAKKPFGHWSQGLLSSMDDPELRVEEDDTVVIIKDKYPKAKFHFLILPKEKIPNLKSLTKDHLDLLRHVHKKGEEIAKRSSDNLKFRLGYHAVPSMSLLHMHVISQDLDSPCLKHKKHWNSFTTEYFKDSTEVMKHLEENGKVHYETSKYEDILKKPLKCHICKADFKTIPALKKHIIGHQKDGTLRRGEDQ